MSEWSAGQPQSGAGDQVMYYRKPDGWITWGDSLSGSKQRDFIKRGFVPLQKYGTINTLQREIRAFGTKMQPQAEEYASLKSHERTARYIWEAILTHPDGPAEFPVEQVVSLRWYRPENCPVPEAYFPQLKGHKIRELNCPEACGRAPFVELDGAGGISSLRQHLRVMHGWDQANLLAYGERVGIDFTKADVQEMAIREVEFGNEPDDVLTCEECGQEFSGRMAQARLSKHRKEHPVAEIAVV